MRKKINGFQYDTVGAVEVGTAKNEGKDDSTWTATMYRTPRVGKYFLAGSGGAMTIFKGEQRLIPMSDMMAGIWIKEHLMGGEK